MLTKGEMTESQSSSFIASFMLDTETLEDYGLGTETNWKNNLIAFGIPTDKFKLLQFPRISVQNASKPSRSLTKLISAS